MAMERTFFGSGQSIRRPTTENLITPRQLLTIKSLTTSLDIDAKTECLVLFDSEPKALTATSAAQFIADLRSRLMRQQSQCGKY